MDIVVAPLSAVSIVTIVFIIVALIVALYKKWIMTFAIIAISFVVFVISLVFSETILSELAFRPIYLSFEFFPQLYTLFSSMFLHSIIDPFHIIFNMFMFILIAPNFENHIGQKKFLAIYIITGFCAAISHAWIAPIFNDPSVPYNAGIGLVGASGAISGILGAYAVSFPRDRVFFPMFIIIRIPVLYAGVIFLSFQTMYIFFGGDPHVAYFAHIGGFVSGIIIGWILIRKKDPSLYEQTEKSGRSIYYDSSEPRKTRELDYAGLKKLATTPELKEILKRIKNETVPQVRDIWIEHFIEKSVCPKCGNKLFNLNHKISCNKCGFNLKY